MTLSYKFALTLSMAIASSSVAKAETPKEQPAAVAPLRTAESRNALSIDETDASEPSASLDVRPVPGKLTSPYGWRNDPVRKRRGRRGRKHRKRLEHKGVDFAGRRGTAIHVAGAGVVVRAYHSKSYGRIVMVNHGGGLQTRYAHMQRIKVKTGQRLRAGTVVGTVGSSGRATGPHLHFEVRQKGVAVPPSDVVGFPLPECKKNARDCKRERPRKNNS